MHLLSGQSLEHIHFLYNVSKKITFQVFLPSECGNWLAPAVLNRISAAAISLQTAFVVRSIFTGAFCCHRQTVVFNIQTLQHTGTINQQL